MPGLFDRIKDTTTFSGTLSVSTTFTVQNAPSPTYQTFRNRYSINDGNIPVAIISQGGSFWQVCWCTYTATDTLRVDAIIFSSNSDNAITTSGTSDVFVTASSRAVGGIREINTWNANNYFMGSNVGIGTTSPTNKLHVEGGSALINGGSVSAINTTGGSFISTASGNTSYTSTFKTNWAENILLISAAGRKVVEVGGFTAADSLRLFTADVERLRIDSSGNTGVGTTTPVARLDVSRLGGNWTGVAPEAGTAAFFTPGGGGTTSPNYITIVSGNAASAGLHLGDDADSDIGRILYNNATDSLFFVTNNAERIRVSNTGNVGIGTSSPAARLDVSDTGDAQLRVTSSNGVTPHIYLKRTGGQSYRVGVTSTDPDFSVARYDSSDALVSTPLFIDQTNNVGINTTSPLYMLDVRGNIYGETSSSSGADAFVVRNTSTAGNTNKFIGIQFQGTDTVGTGKNAGLIRVYPSNNDYVDSSLNFFVRRADTIEQKLSISPGGSSTFFGDTAFQPQVVIWNRVNDNNSSYFIAQKSRGSGGGAGAAVQASDALGTYLFRGADSNGNIQNSSSIFAIVTTVTAGSVSSDLQFNAQGGSLIGRISGTEHIRVNGDGVIAIGTSTVPSAPTSRVWMNGDLSFAYSNGSLLWNSYYGSAAFRYATNGHAFLIRDNTDGRLQFGGFPTGTANNSAGAPNFGITLKSSGLVGVGTVGYGLDPDTALSVQAPNVGGTAGNTSRTVRIVNQGGNTQLFDITYRRHTNGSDWTGTNLRLQRTIDATATGFIDFGINGINADQGLGFGSGATTHMVVNPNGLIGIGITSPTTSLDIGRTVAGGTSDIRVINNSTANQTAAGIVLTTGTANSFATARLVENVGASARYLIFNTGSGVNGGTFFDTGGMFWRSQDTTTEYMRITTDGNLRIGTTGSLARITALTTTGAKIAHFQSTIPGTPANLDAQEVITVSANSAVSGLTFSGGDARLMTLTVSPANEVVWRANKVALSATDTMSFYTSGTAERLRITSGGDLRFEGTHPGPTNTLSIGYMGAPVHDKTANYTLVLSDAGKTIRKTGNTQFNITIPADATTNFPIGTCIILDNAEPTGGLLRVTGATGVIMYTYTSSRQQRAAGVFSTINFGGSATIRKIAANKWAMSGAGVA